MAKRKPCNCKAQKQIDSVNSFFGRKEKPIKETGKEMIKRNFKRSAWFFLTIPLFILIVPYVLLNILYHKIVIKKPVLKVPKKLFYAMRDEVTKRTA